MATNTDILIRALKIEARDAYFTYKDETEGFDCGASIAQFILPEAARAARDFDKAMDELAKLDPHTPTLRLTATS